MRNSSELNAYQLTSLPLSLQLGTSSLKTAVIAVMVKIYRLISNWLQGKQDADLPSLLQAILTNTK